MGLHFPYIQCLNIKKGANFAMGADIQTALITAVKCLFTVFFYVNRIRSNFWKVGYYRIRI